MARPIIDKLETIPTTYNNITNPITHGINKNPMKNVIDPHNINANETPNNIDANPAGDIWDGGTGRRGCLRTSSET
ncbi:hypothetical protein Hanom_Chr17g01537851 [Helianthus anomalus]